eukprot:gene15790-18722_t
MVCADTDTFRLLSPYSTHFGRVASSLFVIFVLNEYALRVESAAPDSLSNFQGIYACDSSVNIGRPTTPEDVAALIKAFPRVKASGVGHSWWGEQFCSGINSTAINIMMQNMRPLMISIDENAKTVKVSAGVTVRQLLDYLMYAGSINSGYTLKGAQYNTIRRNIHKMIDR